MIFTVSFSRQVGSTWCVLKDLKKIKIWIVLLLYSPSLYLASSSLTNSHFVLRAKHARTMNKCFSIPCLGLMGV